MGAKRMHAVWLVASMVWALPAAGQSPAGCPLERTWTTAGDFAEPAGVRFRLKPPTESAGRLELVPPPGRYGIDTKEGRAARTSNKPISQTTQCRLMVVCKRCHQGAGERVPRWYLPTSRRSSRSGPEGGRFLIPQNCHELA